MPAARATRAKDRENFEFVVPVNLPGGRYAYEVIYDHRTYDAQLHDMRMVLLLVGLLALFGGGAVFYWSAGACCCATIAGRCSAPRATG